MADRSCWLYRHAGRAALGAALLFVLVAALVVSGATQGTDVTVEALAASWRSQSFLQGATLVTTLGTAPFLVGAAIIAWLLVARVGDRSEAYLPLLPLAVESLANPLIKGIFQRHRPTPVAWPPGLFGVDQYSFPSGHAMSSAALYSLLVCWAWAYWPWRGRVPVTILLVLVPVAIGLSRVALGDHWLSDVVGGWLAGILVTTLVVWLWVKLSRKAPS